MEMKLASWYDLYVIHPSLGQVNMLGSPSASRISGELFTTGEVVFYDEQNPEPFRISCLYDPDATPSGEINGTAIVSTTSKYTTDDIFNVNKRHVTESFDRDVTELKRRRTTDILHYSGLVERENRVEIVWEFIPESIKRSLRNTPPDILSKIVKSVRCLQQEYGYTVLERMLRNKVLSIPTIRETEDLERAMLVNQAEKVNVHFYARASFFSRKGIETKFGFEISLSGYSDTQTHR
jgi:hypothetical protein